MATDMSCCPHLYLLALHWISYLYIWHRVAEILFGCLLFFLSTLIKTQKHILERTGTRQLPSIIITHSKLRET